VPGRVARVVRVKTITTNPNSLKNGSEDFVATKDGTDCLTIGEIERLFGLSRKDTKFVNFGITKIDKIYFVVL
jgi:hypothetical protein